MSILSRIIAILIACGSTAFANVKPHALFTDGCVLQQGMPVPVWGTASEGEKVTVEFQQQKVSAVAKDGKWMVKLSPLKAGGPFQMRISGNHAAVINNVLVGEVWLCSGQSNMAWRVNQSENAEAEIA